MFLVVVGFFLVFLMNHKDSLKKTERKRGWAGLGWGCREQGGRVKDRSEGELTYIFPTQGGFTVFTVDISHGV